MTRPYNFLAIPLISDVLATLIYQPPKILPASHFAGALGISNSATRFFTALPTIVTTHTATTMNKTRAQSLGARARLAKFSIPVPYYWEYQSSDPRACSHPI